MLRFISSSSGPLNLVQHREKFQDRALRDVTVHYNDSTMMMDPSNPLLVKDEMEAQKVCPFESVSPGARIDAKGRGVGLFQTTQVHIPGARG